MQGNIKNAKLILSKEDVLQAVKYAIRVQLFMGDPEIKDVKLTRSGKAIAILTEKAANKVENLKAVKS